MVAIERFLLDLDRPPQQPPRLGEVAKVLLGQSQVVV